MRPMRDPAPSRLAYRINRLMLTPRFRVFLRYGLPVLIVAALAAGWASDEGRRQGAAERLAELRRQVEERPEFMVHMMAVENATEPVIADVRELLPIDFPISSFDLDLDDMQTRIEDLDAVAAASVRVRSGGVLEVEIEERIPAAIWRSGEGLVLVDAGGYPVAPAAHRADHPALPLLAGQGADAQVAEALALVAAAGPIAGRLRGLVRVGARRWDLVLDRDQRILLPERGALTALEKVVALHRAQDLLERDIAAVDFRNPARPVLRLNRSAIDAFYQTDWTISEDLLR